MDKNTIGLKRKKTIQKSKWIPCPDYETVSDKHSWIKRWFVDSYTDKNWCIHSKHCENYEYNELNNDCVAGYWCWYDKKVGENEEVK